MKSSPSSQCFARFTLLATLAVGSANAAEAPPAPPLRDKTLVAWVAPANLTQRGGSVLTLQKSGGDAFDAIVFGELSPAKWMPGSEGFNRTQQDQGAFPAETADSQTLVQVALVYQGNQITLYRNGQPIAAYSVDRAASFPSDSEALIGLRHTGAAPENCFFTGSIEDARIYNAALAPEQIAALRPNQPSDPAPWAWWDFEGGNAGDRQRNFVASTLLGGARVFDGRLRLDQNGAYLFASKAPPQSIGGQLNASVRSLREKLLRDPHRAGYHFVTPEGVCMPFDPNGAIYWKGRYHLFYIYQDKGDHHWGHASSTDLFHWRHHPTGLLSGMFSGNCFINEEGVPTMCYHQVGQGNALAVALDDELNEWKKLETNPITPKTQPGDPQHDKYRSWDPYGWREGGAYYAIFGGERPGLAKAPTLGGEWKYVGDFLANTVPGVSLNEDVSCADFFRIGDKHMLLCISHRLGCRYYFGEWRGEQFHPVFHEMMSWTDNSFFAPESLLDDQGRRIMWAWLMDEPNFKTRADYGWSGTMSLPRVLTLAEDGSLRMNPPVEIERLRYRARTKKDLRVGADSQLALPDIRGNSLELEIEMRAPEATQYGVTVCASPGGEEQTRVYYDAATKKLTIDATASSASDAPKTIEAGPLPLGPDEPLKLRVFVDKSVIEVFANEGRQAVMRRIYPTRPDSLGVALFSNGGPATVPALKAWDISPSNPH